MIKFRTSYPFIDFTQLKFFQVFSFLFCLGICAYAKVLFYPFVHDDIVFIKENPHIATLSNLGDVFHPSSSILSIANPYWRPVLEAVYRLQYQIFGFNPAGYHFINILLHVLNSSLIFYCLKNILDKAGIAFAVAIVFLLHPIQSEAVACISGISNLVYAFFCLLSFLLYLRSSKIFSFFIYAIALLSKEQAIVLPFVILLYEYCFKKNEGFKTFRLIDGFIVVTVLYFILRKLLLGMTLTSIWQYPEELILRLLAIPGAVLMYSRILLWPEGLHYYRSIDILAPWQIPAIGFVVLAAAVVAITFFLKSVTRPLLFALGWFVITLLPTLNIIPIIHEYSYIAAFEHFLYLPMAGFFLYLFLAASEFIKDKEKEGFIAVCLLVPILLGLTFEQNKYWRAEVPLFERVVKYENFGRAHFLLGRAYYFAKQYDPAIAEFKKAIGIMENYLKKIKDPAAKPFYAGFIMDSYFDMAHSYEAKGDWQAALTQYNTILSYNPASAEIENSIGNVYVQFGDFALAKEHFQAAVTLDSRHLMALSNLAVCYIREGDYQQAEKLLNQALSVDPQFYSARRNLEQLQLQKKNNPAPNI